MLTVSLSLYTGQEAVFLRDRAGILKLRIKAINSKQCANRKNKYYCPEVFLDAVADKLTTTADLFLDAELLSKFYYSVSGYPDLSDPFLEVDSWRLLSPVANVSAYAALVPS